MITKKAKKILKLLYKQNYYAVRHSTIQKKFFNCTLELELLEEHGFIESQTYKEPVFPHYIKRSLCAITTKGSAYIENDIKQTIKFWLPIAISIFATIFSFREEILAITQAIMQG